MSERSISINMAMTMDGRTVRPDGKWYGLSSIFDRRRMDEIRLESDALLSGTGTLLADNPVLHVRNETGDALLESPVPVLLFRFTGVPVDSFAFRGPHPPILFVRNSFWEALSPAKRDEYTRHTSSLYVLEDREGVHAIPEILSRNHKMNRILLEGGPRINHAFLSENLVNRIYLTIVPFLIGQEGLSSIVDGSQPLPQFDRKLWSLEYFQKIENELHLTYEKKAS